MNYDKIFIIMCFNDKDLNFNAIMKIISFNDISKSLLKYLVSLSLLYSLKFVASIFDSRHFHKAT